LLRARLGTSNRSAALEKILVASAPSLPKFV
jgi:hypothetical protein